MANAITRSFVTAKAWAWKVGAVGEDGKPTVERVGDVEFVSTKPNVNEAFRALKGAGYKVLKDYVSWDVVREEVYAMDVDTFMANATVVERGKNGRVKALAEDEEE